jgi:hypothetical protein
MHHKKLKITGTRSQQNKAFKIHHQVFVEKRALGTGSVQWRAKQKTASPSQ